MAAIFPPGDQGGIRPGSNVCNGYSPTHTVVGDGPYYVSPDCTTVLTDCQLNAITSEILAAVDLLGLPFNTGRVDNLGRALSEAFDEIRRSLDNFVRRAGDAMQGPFYLSRDPQDDDEAATKHYVDLQDAHFDSLVRQWVNGQIDNVNNAMQNRVLRAGDTMTGPLMLSRAPADPMEAATKAYVDATEARVLIADSPPPAPERSLWWDSSQTAGGGQLYVLYNDGNSTQWVSASPGGGSGSPPFDEAPDDGFIYGRRNRGWADLSFSYLGLTGGMLTGPLLLNADPTAPLGAATRQFVENSLQGRVSTGGGEITGTLTFPGTIQNVSISQEGLNFIDPGATWVVRTSTGNFGIRLFGNTVDAFTAYLNGNVEVSTPLGDMRFLVTKPAGPEACQIVGRRRSSTGVSDRWTVTLGSSEYETGANAGSDFGIARHDDAGNKIDDPITIARSTGRVTFHTDITYTGALTPSDIALKDVIDPYRSGLKEIERLEPVTYRYKTGDQRQRVGVIAQECARHMPEVVLPVNDLLHVDHGALTFALINAVKELSAHNRALEKRVHELEDRKS